MIIYIMDGLGGISDLVDTYKSVIWTMQFFERGDFQLVVPGTQENLNRLTKGRLLVRDMDVAADGGMQNVMVIRNRKLNFDAENGWTLEVTGEGLKSIVGQRIVWQQTNLSGSIEAGIRQVISQNIASPSDTARRIPGFTLAPAAGISATFEAQLLGDNILEWLETVGKANAIGWDVFISGGAYVFELLQGTDRTFDQTAVPPVVFSPEYDNLASAEYEEATAEYKNAALIAGEGEGANQVIEHVGTASGLARYETFVDGGSVSSNGTIITMATYRKMLRDYGTEQLTGTTNSDKFAGSIINNGMFVLGVDYFLGDLVQIHNLHGINAKSRVIEMIYAEDENGASLVPTFSDWEG